MKTYTVKLTNGEKIVVKANGYEVSRGNLVCFYTGHDVHSKVYEWKFSLFNVLYIRCESSQTASEPQDR